MPNPIKAFFEKKKSDAKFKLAGKGQKLGDAAAAENAALARRQAAANQSQTAAAAGPRPGPSGAQMNAAQAALAR